MQITNYVFLCPILLFLGIACLFVLAYNLDSDRAWIWYELSRPLSDLVFALLAFVFLISFLGSTYLRPYPTDSAALLRARTELIDSLQDAATSVYDETTTAALIDAACAEAESFNAYIEEAQAFQYSTYRSYFYGSAADIPPIDIDYYLTQSTVHCAACGEILSATGRYCPSCGELVAG